jgi:transposase
MSEKAALAKERDREREREREYMREIERKKESQFGVRTCMRFVEQCIKWSWNKN